jgi:ribonucleoside-diphosphate reductase alpha chain
METVDFFTKIRKRNGEIVDFDRSRIERAIEKACIAEGFPGAARRIPGVTDAVIAELANKFGTMTPSVEDVQDAVERQLAANGLWEVAKAYILYRKERERARDAEKAETLHKIDERKLSVRRADGTLAPFDPLAVEAALEFFSRGRGEAIDRPAIVRDTVLAVFDGIPEDEVDKALIMAVRSRIELDPSYSQLAARLLWNRLYRETIGVDERASDFESRYRVSLEAGVRAGVKEGRLDPRLLAMDFGRLSAALVIDRDRLFYYLGAHTLYDRYFMKTVEDKHLEAPQCFWMRVAMGLALNEEDKEGWAMKFYERMSRLEYVPSTPTLFHSGTSHPQLSSCYISTVNDSLEHIFKCIGDNAMLSKWSGGLGNDWTDLRATGAKIKGTGVESQGIIPFLKVANDATAAINRSGRRRGAACAYLETWHYDIEGFLELRKNTGDERRRTHDMNTANWIPDLFMKRVKDDGDWTLFSPDETPDLHGLYGRAFEERYAEYEKRADAGEIKLFRRLRARDLWKKMLSMLFETGHPWLTWKDPCNIRSPQDHAGVVRSSNLCTEITLNTSADETAVCNLGSVNLATHIAAGRLDAERLGQTVRIAIRMLDNVIDLNFYPTKEAKAASIRHRPVGLGLMGFQDALFMLDIDYASEAALDFADASMELIAYNSILASSELAAERGRYASYRGSKWDRGIFPADTLDLLEAERGMKIEVPRGGKLDWTLVRESVRRNGMRNSNCLALAPTATISNIAGSLPAAEPIYKNIYVKSNQFGDFAVVNRYLVEDLKKEGLWDGRMVQLLKFHDGRVSQIAEIPARLRAKYKETFEIDSRWLIYGAARRGKWIDQSQSVNVFYSGSSGKDLNDVYFLAWELGLKTTYYLRTLAASQVEKSTVSTSEFGSTHKRAAQTASASVQTSVEAKPLQRGETLGEVKPPKEVSPQFNRRFASAPEVSPQAAPQLKGLCRIDDPHCESCQ